MITLITVGKIRKLTEVFHTALEKIQTLNFQKATIEIEHRGLDLKAITQMLMYTLITLITLINPNKPNNNNIVFYININYKNYNRYIIMACIKLHDI